MRISLMPLIAMVIPQRGSVAAALLSRALAGIARGKVVFVLPGSRGAVQLALEKLILPELGHLASEAVKSASEAVKSASESVKSAAEAVKSAAKTR